MPSDLFDPPQTELVSESLYEHLELAHYVEIFRGSADRVRYVIFVIIVFSIVILVAQWNTTDLSWVPQRYRKLNELYDAVRRMPEPAADERVRKQTRARFLSRDDLKENLSEYRKLRVEHVFLVQMPGMGATFDINDLGLFSGITYVLLLLLLLFSLMREHENLYLALFKVRRLHDRPGTIADGESTANYLYHSLAMSQVLSSPPTLAQWRPSSFKIAILNVVFIVPAAVQAYIIYVNYQTLPIAQSYGASTSVMFPQYVLFILVVIMGALAITYADACNKRWKSAFLHVNPALARVAPLPSISGTADRQCAGGTA